MKIIIYPSFQHLDTFIRSIPDTFEHCGQTLREGRNTIKRVEAGNFIHIIKKYKTPNLFQRIVYTLFRRSKARRAYEYAARFRDLGFETPHEVAYIEVRKTLLFHTGYFISIASHDEPISDVIAQPGAPTEYLAQHLAAFMQAIHKKGILHGDTNFTNILCRYKIIPAPLFTLIDTNRTRFRRHLSRRACLKNMIRMPHDLDFYTTVVRHYARIRGWDEEECLAYSFRQLRRLDKKRKLKQRFK